MKGSTGLRFVTTPMHGVGHRPVFEALAVAGFSLDKFIPVEEQKEPDPDFPTVPFPNPEEKGESMQFDIFLRGLTVCWP